MTRVWRGAVVGFGAVARNGHLRAWIEAPDFELVAVVDADAERLALARADLPGVRTYRSLAALWAEEEVDFIDVATPPTFHGSIAASALSRGVAVLCEKPLTTSLAEYRVLEGSSRQRGLALHTVHNWHHAPAYRAVLGALRRGCVGRVRHIAIRVERNGCAVGSLGNWRLLGEVAGGGILVDHGWHAFYLAMGLSGEEPRSICAALERRRYSGAEVEDTAHCLVQLATATVELELTWAAERRRTEWYIAGERGEIRLVDRELTIDDGHSLVRQSIPSLSHGSHHPEWFTGVVAEFREALQDPQKSNLREAGWCTALLHQAYRSAQMGEVTLPVHWPASEEQQRVS